MLDTTHQLCLFEPVLARTGSYSLTILDPSDALPPLARVVWMGPLADQVSGNIRMLGLADPLVVHLPKISMT